MYYDTPYKEAEVVHPSKEVEEYYSTPNWESEVGHPTGRNRGCGTQYLGDRGIIVHLSEEAEVLRYTPLGR